MNTKVKRTEPSNGGLMNPNWRYVNKDHNDIRVTFERVRVQQQASQPQRALISHGSAR